MKWLNPEAILLCLLVVFFLVRRKWRLAFAAFGFIVMAGFFSWFLENSYGAESRVTELAVSVLMIIGCVWLAVSGLMGLLGKGREESRS